MRRAVSLPSWRILVLAGTVLFCASFRTSVYGDPLPGEVLKFQQLPLDATPVPRPSGAAGTYWGHDEPSYANVSGGPQVTYSGPFMADDFADHVTSDIVHVSWWGSYISNQTGIGGVKQFLVAFESDVPQSESNPASHPGTVLSAQIVNLGALAPLSGTYTQTMVSAGGPPLGELLYRYNAELKVPFHENADTVYWLKIVALIDPVRDGSILWGWHDRDYTIMDPLAAGPPVPSPGERDLALGFGDPFGPVWHFQDDAVSGSLGFGPLFPAPYPGPGAPVDPLLVSQSGYTPQNYVNLVDGPTGISQFSKDLAFELYYVPEPGCALLLPLVGLLGLRRRSLQP